MVDMSDLVGLPLGHVTVSRTFTSPLDRYRGYVNEPRARERGSVTPFVLIVSIGILLLAGLVIDGGRQMNGHGRAVSYAQEAARAGSQAVDVANPRLDLDSGDALKAASTYCGQAIAKDAQLVSCDPSITSVTDAAWTFKAVRVTTRIQVEAILLGIIGRSELRSTGQAAARPVSGISEADSGKVSEAVRSSGTPRRG